jgi:hypothetical protein
MSRYEHIKFNQVIQSQTLLLNESMLNQWKPVKIFMGGGE